MNKFTKTPYGLETCLVSVQTDILGLETIVMQYRPGRVENGTSGRAGERAVRYEYDRAEISKTKPDGLLKIRSVELQG